MSHAPAYIFGAANFISRNQSAPDGCFQERFSVMIQSIRKNSPNSISSRIKPIPRSENMRNRLMMSYQVATRTLQPVNQVATRTLQPVNQNPITWNHRIG